jgi:hypothetical protein
VNEFRLFQSLLPDLERLRNVFPQTVQLSTHGLSEEWQYSQQSQCQAVLQQEQDCLAGAFHKFRSHKPFSGSLLGMK